MVETKLVMSCRSVLPLSKKKLATSSPFFSYSSAIVCAIVDFPEPGGPLIQHIGGSWNASNHRLISCLTSTRVFGRHLGAVERPEELDSAAPATLLSQNFLNF
jgi:hypothetical protein